MESATSIFGKLSVFLEKELQEEILKTGKVIEANKGDVLIKEGQYLDFLPIVITGKIRVYQQRVKEEFLQSEFKEPLEALHFRSAEISEASARILARKLEHIERDFVELATLDVALPAREKRNVALLVAFRPWVFSMFSSL